MDTTGNLWVIDQNQLNVLDLGTTPAWLGTNNYNPMPTFDIYPNPAKNEVNISINEKSGTLKVVDSFGKEILIQELNQEQQLDVSNWKAGFYLFQLTTENGTAVKRLVIQ